MNNYELTIIIDGKSTPAKEKSVVSEVETIVKVGKGKVTKTGKWGKKELAYPIDKLDTGVYLLFELELDAKGASNISTKLNINEEILRYLLVKKED